jgi:hypothetical protein
LQPAGLEGQHQGGQGCDNRRFRNGHPHILVRPGKESGGLSRHLGKYSNGRQVERRNNFCFGEKMKNKLVALVDTVQNETEERDQDQLMDLGEEVLYNKGNVMSMAQMLKKIEDASIDERAQRAFDEHP